MNDILGPDQEGVKSPPKMQQTADYAGRDSLLDRVRNVLDNYGQGGTYLAEAIYAAVASHGERVAQAEHGRALTEHVRVISAVISDSYPATLDAEAHTWRRVMKVAEEVGEVTQALLGYLGENPRKGQTHTLDDLRTELLDVALAALGAVSYLSADDDDTVVWLTQRAAFVEFRLTAAVVAKELPDA